MDDATKAVLIVFSAGAFAGALIAFGAAYVALKRKPRAQTYSDAFWQLVKADPQ